MNSYNEKEIEMMEHFFVEYKELYEKYEGAIINETFLKLYNKIINERCILNERMFKV